MRRIIVNNINNFIKRNKANILINSILLGENMGYTYPPPPPRERPIGKIIIGILIGLLIGAVIGFAFGYGVLSSEIKEWKEKYYFKKGEYESLSLKYNKLLSNYTILQQKYINLKSEHLVLVENYTRLRTIFEQLKNLSELFEKQTKEVFYYRIFTIYNYKTDEYWYAWYKIPARDYYHYRFDVSTHTPALLNDRMTQEIVYKTVTSWQDDKGSVIREIASDLWYISKGDLELFVNLAIQLVHQICYNITRYTKYPIETLVEGSGDCDNVAILTASILNAKGLDVVVLLVKADGNGHAMLGVNINKPNDLYDYGRKTAWYYEYNGKKYWLIEATWGDPGGKNWIDPATPEAYRYIGAFVGDNPWNKIEIINVVKIEG